MTFKENKPIYLQIADRIMDEILQNVYEEEGRILSVREYAGIVEVNANTVVRTYDYLQTQGIIYNKRGWDILWQLELLRRLLSFGRLLSSSKYYPMYSRKCICCIFRWKLYLNYLKAIRKNG